MVIVDWRRAESALQRIRHEIEPALANVLAGDIYRVAAADYDSHVGVIELVLIGRMTEAQALGARERASLIQDYLDDLAITRHRVRAAS